MHHFNDRVMTEEDRVMILSSIPAIDFDQDKHGHHDSCSICIGEFDGHHKVKLLSCSHLFHENCIDEWI